ncbi:MAG: DNA-directed RNA polymerase subunit alpha [Patescibacteria group bacterium]
MTDLNIILPSKPKIIFEGDNRGVYEIEGLYPGYGQTLGNSLRRIVLSSMIGVAITSLRVEGAPHEFSTLEGVKEDVLAIILNLKQVRFKMEGDEPQIVTLAIKGAREVMAADIKLPGQVEVMNPKQYITTMTNKTAELKMELTLEKGIGYLPKEMVRRDKTDIGTVVLDAAFSPIRRVGYEVENMRVGDRTDYNRLRINIETDGLVEPREALEKSIEIMIHQLKAIVGFKEDRPIKPLLDVVENTDGASGVTETVMDLPDGLADDKKEEILKTRIENLELSTRTLKALAAAGIRTLGGLARKKESDLEEVGGLGGKGIEEIRAVLSQHDMVLK